jgi:uncharacterized protein (DUF924 family)
MTNPDDILGFWFGAPATTTAELQAKVKRWFVASPEFDREVALFTATVERALAGELAGWRDDPRSRLALIIVLDQFTRTLFRGEGRAFAGDATAQQLSIEVFDRELHRAFTCEERLFLVMPLHHAEELALQRRAGTLFRELVTDASADDRPVYAMACEQSEKYQDIVARFGRFPHRNAALARPSTEAEQEFLRDWAERQHPAGLRQK